VPTVDQLAAAVQGIEAVLAGPFQVTSLQEHMATSAARLAAEASAAQLAAAEPAGASA
jgi:carbamoyl-phosphate synthase large subunit